MKKRGQGKTPIERLLSRTVEGPVVKEFLGPCLDCLYATNDSGYPLVWDVAKGYSVSAHRLMLAHKLGRPIKDGYCSLHHCDRPRCVRPEHLYEGTNLQNIKDRDSRGRTAHLTGERNAASRLTVQQVQEIRELHSQGVLQYKIAEMFGVSRGHICTIISYKRWRHVA